MVKKIDKLPISALVVSYNEANLLDTCLSSIQFCEEIIVVDLESTDNSVAVSQKWATQVFNHPLVPIVEIIHKKFISKLKNDWVLLTDPDEQTSGELANSLKNIFSEIPSEVGKVQVPIQYYFKNKKLKGTIWGGIKYGRFLLHQRRIELQSNVHQGIQLKKGNTVLYLPFNEQNFLHHYWMNNYQSLFEKHLRYIKQEGKSKYESGLRYSVCLQLKGGIIAFKNCFFDSKGYLDGFTGLFLSLFWTWYVVLSWLSLKKYQKTHEK